MSTNNFIARATVVIAIAGTQTMVYSAPAGSNTPTPKSTCTTLVIPTMVCPPNDPRLFGGCRVVLVEKEVCS